MAGKQLRKSVKEGAAVLVTIGVISLLTCIGLRQYRDYVRSRQFLKFATQASEGEYFVTWGFKPVFCRHNGLIYFERPSGIEAPVEGGELYACKLDGTEVRKVECGFPIIYASTMQFLQDPTMVFLTYIKLMDEGREVELRSIQEHFGLFKIESPYKLRVVNAHFHIAEPLNFGAVSPDGNKIVVLRWERNLRNPRLSVWPLNSGVQRPIIEVSVGPVSFGWPSVNWSPDSKRLAFVSFTPGGSRGRVELRIEMLNISSCDRIVLFRTGKHVHGLRWSPDGSWLSFTLHKSPLLSDAYAIQVASGEVRPLVVCTSTPVWTSDSKFIIYERIGEIFVRHWRATRGG